MGRASVALKQIALPFRVARMIRSAAVHGATHASSSPLRSAIAMSPARRTFAYSASGVFLMNPLRVAMTRCSDEPFSRSATSAETRSPVCVAYRVFGIGAAFEVRLASGVAAHCSRGGAYRLDL